MEEQSSLFQCATLEFGSSSDSQERIYGPRGEICQGPAERDKIFQGHGGFFVFFFFHGVAGMKDANPSLMDQDPPAHLLPAEDTRVCRRKEVIRFHFRNAFLSSPKKFQR